MEIVVAQVCFIVIKYVMYIEQYFIMIKGKYNYIYKNQSNVYYIVRIYCEDLILLSNASTHFWIHIILVWIWYSKIINISSERKIA